MALRFIIILRRGMRAKQKEKKRIAEAIEEAKTFKDPKDLLSENRPKAPMTLSEVLNIQGWCTFIKFPSMKDEELIEKLKKAFGKNI